MQFTEMARPSRRTIRHVRRAISQAPVAHFGFPHLVVDGVLPQETIADIERFWPHPGVFSPEVRGSHLFHFFKKNYNKLEPQGRRFWSGFNETIWPEILTQIALRFAPAARVAFGDLFDSDLSLDGGHPLTFMQADGDYRGHGAHTHFYHCPHWLFTVLLYVDRSDTFSPGTRIERLLARGTSDDSSDASSYRLEDIEWRTDVAMDVFGTRNGARAAGRFETREYAYKANRLVAFLDGPLAFHSVADTPNRAAHPLDRARRRILRSHVKIHHDPFYARHAASVGGEFEPERFMRAMKPGGALSDDDRRFESDVLAPFFRERVACYARADAASRARPGFWTRAARALAIKGAAAPALRRRFLNTIP